MLPVPFIYFFFQLHLCVYWASLVAQLVKNLLAMQETQVWPLGQEYLLERGMATPVFLPGKFHGQRSQAGYSPWDLKESDMTVWLQWTAHGWYLQLVAPWRGKCWKKKKKHGLFRSRDLDFNSVFSFWYELCCCAQSVSRVWYFCDPMDCSLPGSSVHGIF